MRPRINTICKICGAECTISEEINYMRIINYIRKVFRFGLHDNEGKDPHGFPLHDESRPHLHVIAYGKRSIEYLSKAAQEELEAEVYGIPDRARAAGI